ncbi:MAG: MerR family transcriptional regulator [Krumholzibacteria bacterium]|nr:MerR family transcriptional regulator [Candidatus Krumholzibacteria bacterium]
MSTTEYTLDDLVQATGFSKRQIRFYITKQLVPGAGESRGPYATYGEETLRRLRLIGVLKDKRIEPTGRAMTLDEIGHALDTLSADGSEALLAGRAELAILDTDTGTRLAALEALSWGGRAAPPTTPGSATIREWHASETDARPALPAYRMEPTCSDPAEDATAAVTDQLERLRDLLAAAGADLPVAAAGGHPQWRRASSPLVEFHVRQPDTPADRARLQAMARALHRLLTREDDHDLDP